MEMKRAQDSRRSQKEDQDRRLTLPDFRTYPKSEAAETVWYQHGDGHTGQWNGTEPTHQSIHLLESRDNSLGEDGLLTNGAETTG